MRHRFVLTIVSILLLVPALVPPARGQSSPAASFASTILSDSFNLPGALHMVARRFFDPPRGVLVTVRKLHDYPLFAQDAEFEKYEAATKDGTVLGTFVRMRSYAGGQSIVDIAVRIKDGRIEAVEPLRPVMLDGAPFLEFAKALETVKSEPIRSYAMGLSRIFIAVSYLRHAAQAEPLPPIGEAKARFLKAFFETLRQPIPLGADLPRFTAQETTGKSLTSSSLLGKPTLIYIGMIKRPLSGQVLDWVQRYVRPLGQKVSLVEVLEDTEPEVAQYRLRGGKFTGRTIIDDGQTVHDALHVVFLPTIMVFDGGGKLKARLSPPFDGFESLAAALDKARQ